MPFCIIRHFILRLTCYIFMRGGTHYVIVSYKASLEYNAPLLSPNSSRHFLMFKNLNALQYRLLVSIWMSREVCRVGTVTDCCFELPSSYNGFQIVLTRVNTSIWHTCMHAKHVERHKIPDWYNNLFECLLLSKGPCTTTNSRQTKFSSYPRTYFNHQLRGTHTKHPLLLLLYYPYIPKISLSLSRYQVESTPHPPHNPWTHPCLQ